MGNLTVEQLRGLAHIAETHELHEIRVTQDQNMFLANVTKAKIESLARSFGYIGPGRASSR